MILPDSLPGFKPLLPASLSAAAGLHVLRFALLFLLHHGRLSLSAAADILRSDVRNVGNLARFLCGQCPNLALLHACQSQLLDSPCARRGTWIFAVDSTFIGQQGLSTQNTFSRGNTQQRAKKSNRKQNKHHRRSCHGFVFGLLLRPDGVRIPFWLPYYTKDYCEMRHLPYLTQTQLAAQLIAELPLPEDTPLVVVGDTAFEAESIRRVCATRNYRWVTPLNPERVLAGPKGKRPKVLSLVDTLSVESFARVRLEPGSDGHVAQRRAAPCRRRSLRKGRTYWVHSRIAEVHSVGRVVLLFSNKDQVQSGQKIKADKVLMSDATEASVTALLGWYGLRWQVELFFKELKSDLKMCQYSFKRFDQVQGWVELCVLCFAYLEWYRAQRLRQPELTETQKREWAAARTHRLKEEVRAQVEREEIERLYRWTEEGAEGLERLRAFLRSALDHPLGGQRHAG
jgi:Transposase DDE domain